MWARFDEAQPRQFPDHLAVDGGLEVEVELFEGFDPGEARQLEAALHAPLVAPAPLGLQRLREEPLVVQIPLGRLLAEPIELGQQVLHLHALKEGGQFHCAASS